MVEASVSLLQGLLPEDLDRWKVGVARCGARFGGGNEMKVTWVQCAYWRGENT